MAKKVNDNVDLMDFDDEIVTDDVVSTGGKKYKDFTDEEKLVYKEKRDAWKAKRNAELSVKFDTLEGLITDAKILSVIKEIRERVEHTGNRSVQSPRLLTLFGTAEPKPNTTVSFDFISLRGPNGERMEPNETKKAFINRMNGDVEWIKDARTINEMVWYINRGGKHNVTIDIPNTTVTFVN